MREFFIAGFIALLSMATVQAKEVSVDPSKAKQNDQDLELIYRLAERPIGIVKGDRCEIRGAVWGNGPRPGVKQSLVNVITGETFRTSTGNSGVYSLSIPYSGYPIVLREQIDEEIFVAKQFSSTAKVINGGVVCDHRLTTAALPTPNHKETK